ncbi:MAG: type II toxin-antitoxin system HicB family antitoxin [Chloroflexota bacterium]
MEAQSYTVIIRQDNSYFVGLCLELNVASQGESLNEARRNMGEAIVEYLDYVREIGAEGEIGPVPFKALREFLLDGLGDAKQAEMEVYAVAA